MKSKECAKNLAEPANVKGPQYIIAIYNKVWGAMPGEKKGSGEKRWKRVLTKREGFGILTKLSARWWAVVESERKKLLTAKLKCGNLNRLLRIRDGPGVKNFWKKFLTSGMKSSIIAMFRRERRAPCKLNNVTKRKHQKVIPFRWYDQRTKSFCRVESITGGMGKWSYGK